MSVTALLQQKTDLANEILTNLKLIDATFVLFAVYVCGKHYTHILHVLYFSQNGKHMMVSGGLGDWISPILIMYDDGFRESTSLTLDHRQHNINETNHIVSRFILAHPHRQGRQALSVRSGCPVCVRVCVSVGGQHASARLSSGLSHCLSPCLPSHASIILSVCLSIVVRACVSMGEMTTGLPTVLTTCSIPFSCSSTPPFHPNWPLYLDHPCCSVWPRLLFCAKRSHYSGFSM